MPIRHENLYRLAALTGLTFLLFAFAPPITRQSEATRPSGKQLEACGDCSHRLVELRQAAHALRLAAADHSESQTALARQLELVDRAHLSARNAHLVLLTALTQTQRAELSVPLRDIDSFQETITHESTVLGVLLAREKPARPELFERARTIEKTVIRWQMLHELIDHAMHRSTPPTS